MNDKMLNWLQNWIFKNYNENYIKNSMFFLRNIGNPGWAITLQLEDSIYENKKFNEIEIERTDNNWCYYSVKKKELYLAGGPLNLNEILSYFKNFIEEKKEINDQNFIENEIINWLQKWYFDQCDEYWEDSERIVIRTTEYGWHFSMFLEETIYEGKFFEPIQIKKTETDWYNCYRSEYRFEAKGGIFNLIDILNVFINWINKNEN
jgi:hypothetical protein